MSIVCRFSKVRFFLADPYGEHSSYVLTRWLFLRLLGIVYLVAFLSLWVQVEGLIGRQGILPAADWLAALRERSGPQRYWSLPTLFWLNASDDLLSRVCGGGALLSLLLMADVAPRLILLLLWGLYLSLTNVGGEFLSYQWDVLLLETGFLAIFLAPRRLSSQWTRPCQDPLPSRLVVGLLWWLLFRLMLGSGLAKLASGDETWRNLSALAFHYQSQPLPTWVAWYAHQLPAWFHQSSTLALLIVEIAIPFGIFAPRSGRLFACAVLVALQLLMALTTNQAYLNLLVLTLCVLLLDDRWLCRFFPRRWLEKQEERGNFSALPAPSPLQMLARRGQVWGVGVLAAAYLVAGALQTVRPVLKLPLPAPLTWALGQAEPFHLVNHYGMFAVMTTSRPEIILEGSRDGETWLAYPFRWKPGDLQRRPGFVAPHQPRLDWQMWFAALGSYRQNLWLIGLMAHLLQGSPDVLRLFADNPFPEVPPRFLRAVVYHYRFTDPATRQATGRWWERELKGLYAPVMTWSKPGGVYAERGAAFGAPRDRHGGLLLQEVVGRI